MKRNIALIAFTLLLLVACAPSTMVVVQTPTPENQSACIPLENMDYSDVSTMVAALEAYVSRFPDVESVKDTFTQNLYLNTTSQSIGIQYISRQSGNIYIKKFLVYTDEFGWKEGTFSIDGQCWIDPPH
jgi:hypothetical protein